MDLLSILIRLLSTGLAFFLPDLLLYGAVKKAWNSRGWKIYLISNLVLFGIVFLSSFLLRESTLILQRIQLYFFGLFVAILFAKVFTGLLLLVELFIRFIYSLFTKKKRKSEDAEAKTLISRRQFIAKGAILTGLLPMTGIIYGMAKGRFRFTLHEVDIAISNLPPAFDGFTITQLSDLHIGSFDHSTMHELADMVQEVNALGSDAIFFTGDIVNSRADEMDGWYELFRTFHAETKLSILGNHDYGDYVNWPDEAAKERNLDQVKAIHGKLGFQLLLNERTVIEKDGQQLHIIGIENWGKGDFPKFGDLGKAAAGLTADDCMILLSHDPSFWDAHVLDSPFQPELTLSGHTHGFQMGIETPAFRFSPSQWVYRQWAGLYAEGRQQIYVNRGLGTVGYPGRLGIWPEITKIRLIRE
ncbi:MAG: metallophosphoesterase [Chitinophagales bacterium]|nr:metallophosphoesterase [Chitinophagales bacterium]HAE13168.1 phosphoesterase [Bacteroidota bacterium]MCB9019364.1 metallophosphoesterase [Chitinophagales bacterium]MCB9022312.1 metallophosphoesterase [Chitinophagales bacterium]HAE35440.1 phosphoesterase [Bacteroidota bacterium]